MYLNYCCQLIDLLTVNETSIESPIDDPEMLNTLALEATFVCNNFSQQVLKMVCPVRQTFCLAY